MKIPALTYSDVRMNQKTEKLPQLKTFLCSSSPKQSCLLSEEKVNLKLSQLNRMLPEVVLEPRHFATYVLCKYRVKQLEIVFPMLFCLHLNPKVILITKPSVGT